MSCSIEKGSIFYFQEERRRRWSIYVKDDEKLPILRCPKNKNKNISKNTASLKWVRVWIIVLLPPSNKETFITELLKLKYSAFEVSSSTRVFSTWILLTYTWTILFNTLELEDARRQTRVVYEEQIKEAGSFRHVK